MIRLKSVFTSLCAIALAVPAFAAKRPNIVYIMADDLGYAELGSYGQKLIKTPHLDQLAAEGMRFTQHYTASPVCASARCSLMTGRHGGHSYVRTNYEIGTWDSYRGQLPLRKDDVTIAEVLKKAGYVTGAFGKWGLGEPGSSGDPLNQGFDRFYGFNCQRHAHNLFPKYLVDDREKRPLKGNTRSLTGETYGPESVADEMLKFIRQHKDEPFFVYYPTVIPHLALQVPDDELKQYEGQWKETPYKGRSYLSHPKPRAAYAAMITFMDKQVGRLMTLLKELRLDDNTIVLFTSDNGTTFLKEQVDFEFFNSVDGLRGLKGSVYEGGIRVPLLARWPGKIKAGQVSGHICSHYDAMATLAEIAGTKPDTGTDGISYLPALLGKKQKKHDYVFWDFAGYGGQLAVRQGNWKAVKQNLKKNPKAPLELYNLKDDRAESKDVAKQNPKIAERLERIMVEARDEPVIERFRFGKY